MPKADLRTRLQRLRTQKVKRDLRTDAAAAAPAAVERRAAGVEPPPLSDALPGRPVTTPQGTYQLIETRYALDFQHGPKRLADLLTHNTTGCARLARDDAFLKADLRSLAFIDTETTGLMGGAGTLVFLVGVGVLDGDDFVLRQYFLSEPAEEHALLTDLVADLAPRAGWVTFNGRAFDLPLLEMRLTLNRQRGALGQRPHLDLLAPARRLYRGRLPSCSLGTIEHEVFHILREQDDVPGYLIPQLYTDYLRTHDPRDMRRVIYHNTVDVLSMVTLAAHLLEVFAGDSVAAPRAKARSPEELLRLALWHDDNGRISEAEAAYRQALAARLNLNDRQLGLRRLALLFKRQQRRADMVPLWEQLASFTVDDPEAFVELSKYYEWHAPDLPKALAWAERATAVVNGWPRNWEREEALAKLAHRLERLQRKKLARG
jgi:uncharacterized protein YprB with RNaseH-like and TPR domain